MQEGTPIIIKKIKKGGHGHHGGAWKVAYADFVTAMMAFFLVMWILGMSDESKEAVAAYFRDPEGFSKKYPRFPAALGITERPPTGGGEDAGEQVSLEQAQMERLAGDVREKVGEDPQLKGMLEEGDFVVSTTAEGLVLELIENETSGEVFFESGSAAVRPKAQQVFAAIAPILGESKRLIDIEGHTDRQPFGGTAYDNYDLSADRALAVKRLLFRNGVVPNQVRQVAGKADTEPRMPEDPYHFSNRRVTILLPYQFSAGSPKKLPANIGNEKVEGAFVMPQGRSDLGVRTPDLKQRFEAQREAETGH